MPEPDGFFTADDATAIAQNCTNRASKFTQPTSQPPNFGSPSRGRWRTGTSYQRQPASQQASTLISWEKRMLLVSLDWRKVSLR